MMGAFFAESPSFRSPDTNRTIHSVALQGDPDPTPLQEKLNDLAELIAKIGGFAGLILFIALMIRFFVQLGTGEPVRLVFLLVDYVFTLILFLL
jgi:hypothetical protein